MERNKIVFNAGDPDVGEHKNNYGKDQCTNSRNLSMNRSSTDVDVLEECMEGLHSAKLDIKGNKSSMNIKGGESSRGDTCRGVMKTKKNKEGVGL